MNNNLGVFGGGFLSQTVKRKSTSETKAGQYMCPECGKIFDDKKSVDKHMHEMHEEDLLSSHGQYYSE
jgi:hypothetical protein